MQVGKIAYTNSLPFYYGLQNSGFELVEGYPAQLNLALHRGQIDAAPVSSLEYLNHQKDYFLLPDLSISARRFSGSVLLFSREKIERLNHSAIALSEESLSSAALLRILLKSRFGHDNDFVVAPSRPDEMLEECTAALVIGDSALFYEPQDFVYKYDLAELWWQWTNKPFCFALWAVRREFAAAHPEKIADFAAALKQNLQRNLADVPALAASGMGLKLRDPRMVKVCSYLSNLHYNLEPDTLDGLMLFYQHAHELGLSPKFEPFEFFNLAFQKS